MTQSPQILWQNCLDDFRSRVNEQQYNTWFIHMKFKSFDVAKNELVVFVPSQFFYEYLEEHFRRIIHFVINQYFGGNVVLSYEVKVADEIVKQGSDSALEFTQKPPVQPAVPDFDSQLNEKYNFGNFVEGQCNKLPRSIGQSIAERPEQTTFTPLFIYGPSGVGKTHLVNAIGLRAKELHPQLRVLYISAHLLMVQFTESRKQNTFNDFIHFYQSIDLLIVDDVQELVGMTATQDAFFHIFNHLKQNGKNIILTCDRPPVALQGMPERLITRFKGGLMAEMEKPEESVRRSILRNYIKHDGLNIPDNVIDYISTNVSTSVRDLEGVIHTLLAYSVVYNTEVTLAFAQRILQHSIRAPKKEVTIDNIVSTTCEYYGVKEEEIFGRSRKANLVLVRQISMYLAQKHTKMTTTKIGIYVGGRDHATVIHGIKNIENRLGVDKELQHAIQELESIISGK